MTSSSFNDAGRRHELRTVRGLPVSRAKLPNCGLDPMLCLVGSQSILAPLGKAVPKAPEHLIQAASGRFRARFEGCALGQQCWFGPGGYMQAWLGVNCKGCGKELNLKF